MDARCLRGVRFRHYDCQRQIQNTARQDGTWAGRWEVRLASSSGTKSKETCRVPLNRTLEIRLTPQAQTTHDWAVAEEDRAFA